MTRIFILLLIQASLSACAVAPWRNTNKIVKGMTQEQLIKYVGKPKSKVTTGYYTDFLYDIASSPLDTDRSDTETYVARLVDGKITSFGLYTGKQQTQVNNYGRLHPWFNIAYLMPGNENVSRNSLPI